MATEKSPLLTGLLSETKSDSKADAKVSSSGKLVATLKDGRRIGYEVTGSRAEDARSVFFFPGAGCSRFSGPLDKETLPSLNVRLITLERPGIGLSDPQAGRTILSWADDAAAVMDHLKIEKAYFVAHSAGCPHLAAFCFRFPGRVIRAALVCPPNPLQGKEVAPEQGCKRGCQKCCLLNCGCCLKGMYEGVVAKWAKDPREFTKFSKKEIVAPKDLEWLKVHPEFDGIFEKSMHAAIGETVHGPKALCVDMLIAGDDWKFKLSSLQTETDVWYGTDDQVTPNGLWVSRVIPRARGFPCQGYGHNLIFMEFDQILANLLRLANGFVAREDFSKPARIQFVGDGSHSEDDFHAEDSAEYKAAHARQSGRTGAAAAAGTDSKRGGAESKQGSTSAGAGSGTGLSSPTSVSRSGSGGSGSATGSSGSTEGKAVGVRAEGSTS